ncbi:hypothetical protein VTL71DRAFT_8095 [Oculimacula yallundae]|uniref:Uncharacterized protein n=1 Tax=Oculimacula yallundae TaxID=86028 RepID=A0ABR4CWU2_9HELO
MVDDTMEISSDHGYGDDQGDIDIDLDLTAGPGDEDFVLEDADAIPNIDFGTDFQAQTSAAVDDDIMADDDNKSYQMEDAELMEEETEHIIEQESMSFANDGDASYFGVDDQDGEQPPADDTNGYSYNEFEPINGESAGFDDQQDAQGTMPDDLQNGPTPLKMSDQFTQAPQAQGNQTPGSQTPKSSHSLPPTVPAEPRSPPTSIAEPGATTSHITHDHTDPASPGEVNNSTAGTAQTISSSKHVVVVYREVEYTLFSSSENDDPDSYFLTDTSIAEQPLSALFMAIREVIREDLADEDELCIVVDSLGLQIEEVSSTVGDVSLSQLLNLHAKLSENDGPEYTSGCQIALKTKANFSRRYANLVAAAAEGRGLSEFTYWDEQSIGPNDSEDAEESKQEFESNVGIQGVGEAAEDEEEQRRYDQIDGHETGNDQTAQDDDKLQLSDTQVETVEHPTISKTPGNEGDIGVESLKSPSLKVSKKVQDLGSDIDEDGDLIDYSDEEVGVVEKQKTPARHTDHHEANTEEFEKKDELLRRRSLDRRQSSAGVNLEEHEEEDDETDFGQQQVNKGGEASFITEEDGTAYEPEFHPVENEEITDENQGGYEQSHPEKIPVDGFEHFAEDPLAYGDDQNEIDDFATASAAQDGTENGDLNALLEYQGEDEDYDGHHLDHDTAAAQGANSEAAIANFENDDLEFEIEGVSSYDDSKQENHLSQPNEENGNLQENGNIDIQDGSKPSTVEITETAESSVTMDADEIQYDDGPLESANNLAESDTHGSLDGNAIPETVSVVEAKDEIDYDDDEDVVEPSKKTLALVPDAQVPQNANGKRSIGDFESNDAQTLQTNDAKRPRS